MSKVHFDLTRFFRKFSEPPEDFPVSHYRHFVAEMGFAEMGSAEMGSGHGKYLIS